MLCRRACLLLVCCICSTGPVLVASPAPPPLPISPANAATNVDPDPVLAWRWIDELLINPSFENGLSPGWTTSGPNPTMWQIYQTPTNKWATVIIPNSTTSSAQLIQDFYIPADAVSATIQWNERVLNLMPTQIGRFRVLLYKEGNAIARLEDATGNEPVFQSRAWVTRSTNLLAHAGSSLQVVIQVDTFSPAAVTSWSADVDAFSVRCEHPTTPQFVVYVGKNLPLRSSDQAGITAGLSFDSVALAPSSTYYWSVAAVRDGVANFSNTNRFSTGQRNLPELTVLGLTFSTVRLGFLSRTNRYYTIQQSDTLGDNASWADVTLTYPGTGAAMEIEPYKVWIGNAFWRLRVSP